jgi:hypothetical protein
MSPDNKSSVAFDDLVWGVLGIAKVIKRPKRQAQYLIDKKKIRVDRVGPKTLVTTHTRLREDFAKLLSESAEKSD